MRPFATFALRWSESFVISRPIREYRMRSVPFACPSETPTVQAGAISRTGRSSSPIRAARAACIAWTTFPVTPR
jgi:hypothetical protein